MYVCRYHLTGSDAGKIEIFVDNLPGLPDNISHSSKGGYWIGIAAVRTTVMEVIVRTPIIRKILSKVKHFMMSFILWYLRCYLMPFLLVAIADDFSGDDTAPTQYDTGNRH